MDFGYDRFSQDAQAIRNSLVYLDALAINHRFSEHVRVSKALVLVWMAASLEHFWKAYLSELSARVEAASAAKRRRNLASAAIFYFDTLSSLGNGKKLKRWERAAELFSGLTVPGVTAQALPYDGRTVRPDHILLAWQIFCLKGPEFPSPIHKQDLNALADQRNDVAHGLADPGTIGGSLTVGDLRVRLARLDDLALHCVLAADAAWP